MSGEQIIQFLRQALCPENAARELHALRGNVVGLPHVAGIRLRIDPASPDMLDVCLGDKPLKPEGRYIVASTDFEFSEMVGYLPIPATEIEFGQGD